MTAAASPSRRRTAAAESLAADKELGDRIDIFEHFVGARPLRAWRIRRRGAAEIRRRSGAAGGRIVGEFETGPEERQELSPISRGA